MSFDTKEVLKSLCLADGVAGQEGNVCQIAAEILSRYSSHVTSDSYGNVYARISEAMPGRPHLLLEAHIDEIGLIVTHIEKNGFLKVANCGGVDRRLLLAQQVKVHGKRELIGVVTSKPPHLENDDERSKVPELDAIAIDIGLSKEEAEQVVSLGDRVSFCSDFRELLNDRVSVKAVDDRAGMAAILYALEQLDKKTLSCGLSVLFSSQEELGERGAAIGGYQIAPDVSISVDVSFGHTPDAPEHKCGKLGEGPMIGIAPSLNQEISDGLIAAAKQVEISYQLEIMDGETSTDADTIGVLQGGVKTGLVSIPIRYMHTPIETVALRDVEAVGQLLAAYILTEGGAKHA